VQITILETSPAGLQGRFPVMAGQGVSVIMPATDLGQAVNAARRMIALAAIDFEMVIVVDAVRQGFVKTLNQAAAAVRPAFAAYVAQDALAGKDWLKAAYEKISAENKGLCAFNDGIFSGGLAQFGLARTAFTHAHYGEGNVLFPGYHSHRADEDLSHLAFVLGQYTYASNALLMEIEYRLRRDLNPADLALYARRKPEIYALRNSSS
jgi:hypothetical protein